MEASFIARLSSLAIAAEDTRPAETPSVVDPSDEELLHQVAAGSREALAVLFRRYCRLVRSLVYRVLRDSAEADDMLQDVFISVYEECSSFDGLKGPARNWLFQLAYRRAISRRRFLNARHFYTRVDLDDLVREVADGLFQVSNLDEVIDASLENSRLKAVFDGLSEDQRQTLRLYFIEGYTFDEIAARLGHNRGNVKNHYFRGLEKLRKALFGSKLPGERAV